MPDTLPLLKGTLDTLILKTLSWGPMHGFEIVDWLERRSGGVLGVEDSALYQALHRMDARGLIAAEWGVTGNSRRARYYSLTSAGRQRLRAESSIWRRYSAAVSDVLGATSRAG